MRGRLLLALSLCLGACGPLPNGDVIWDEGGLINDRGRAVHEIIGRGDPVRIKGLCLSACTMFLAVPWVCVYPDAVLMFHGPRGVDGPVTDTEYSAGVVWMSRYYPDPLRQWFLEIGHDRETWLLGRSLIDLGVNACKPEP